MASKIVYVLLGMVALNLALLLFSCPSWDPDTGTCSLVATSSENSTIWDLVVNPTEAGGEHGFWWKLLGSGWGLLGALGVVVGTAVVVGTTIFGKDLTPYVYIAMGLALMTSVYPAIRLFQAINESGLFGDLWTARIMAILIASTFVVVVLFTILDWARGRE